MMVEHRSFTTIHSQYILRVTFLFWYDTVVIVYINTIKTTFYSILISMEIEIETNCLLVSCKIVI